MSRRALRTGTLLVVAAGLGLLGGCTSSSETDAAAPATSDAAPSSGYVEPVEPTATDAPRPAAIDVVLTTVAWDAVDGVTAGGYVSPVLEQHGTCTLRLQQGHREVRAVSTGVADATTTVCGALRIEADAVTAGRWTAVLDYRSAATSGSSAPLVVEVPQ